MNGHFQEKALQKLSMLIFPVISGQKFPFILFIMEIPLLVPHVFLMILPGEKKQKKKEGSILKH